MCGRGRAVGGPRYLNFVRAACEVGPTRYAGGIACLSACHSPRSVLTVTVTVRMIA